MLALCSLSNHLFSMVIGTLVNWQSAVVYSISLVSVVYRVGADGYFNAFDFVVEVRFCGPQVNALLSTWVSR